VAVRRREALETAPFPPDFFCILTLFKKKSRNEPAKIYLQDLALSSRASLVGVTHEGVTPVHMA
jgi:hypothetical protein